MEIIIFILIVAFILMWRKMNALSDRQEKLESFINTSAESPLANSEEFTEEPVPVSAKAININELPTQNEEPTIPEPISELTNDDEFSYGSHWLTITGIIAVLFAAGFFLKYAFDQGIIGHGTLVTLGLLAGAGFLVAGEILRSRMPNYADLITGGGFSLLYLTLFSSHTIFEVLPAGAVFVGMIIVTATAVALAVKRNSINLAAMALAGGYLTPFLAAGETTDYLLLFNYLLLLSVALLTVAIIKNWRQIAWGAAFATLLSLGAWYDSSYTQALASTLLVYLSIYWVVFSSSAVAYSFFNKNNEQTNALYHADMVYLSIVGICYGLWSYSLVQILLPEQVGLLPLWMSIFYAALACFGWSRVRSLNHPLTIYPAVLALAAFTLVFPVQFEGTSVALMWLVEAGVLVVAGIITRSRLLEMAMPVWIIAATQIVFIHSWINANTFMLNERFGLYLGAIVVTLGIAYGCRLRSENYTHKQYTAWAYRFAGFGLSLLVIVTCIDAIDTLSWKVAGTVIAFAYLFYTACAFCYGYLYDKRYLKLSVPLWVVSAIAIFVFKTWVDAEQFIFNERVAAYSAGIGLSFYMAWTLATSYADMYSKWYARMLAAVAVTALLWVTAVDAFTTINSSQEASLMVTVLYLLYAGVAVSMGIYGSYPVLRKSAIIICGLVVIKTFMFDIWLLSEVIRIAAFVVLGISLLFVGYLYHRFADRIKAFWNSSNTSDTTETNIG